MKSAFRILVIMVNLVAVGVLLAQPSKRPFVSRNSPFTLLISPIKNIIRTGDEMRIRVAITNLSDHDLRFRITYPELDYGVSVFRNDGTLAPDTELGQRIRNDQLNPFRVTEASVRPNGVYVEAGDLFVDRLYDMTQ